MSTPSGTARTRATIRDVAALAGVGIKTVSRVINNEANVSAPMRERVQHAVVALNFQPHQGAGALRRGDQRTRTLGLLLDAVDGRVARRRGVATLLMRGIEEEARRIKRTLLVLDTERGSAAEKLYEQVGYTRVGVIPQFALNSDGSQLIDTVLFYKLLE